MSESCRFGNDCAYLHQNITNIKESCEHTGTVELLEKIVREITLKFKKVNQELKDLKEQINLKKTVISEVDQIQETEDVVETNIKDATFKGEETVLHKSMDSEIPDFDTR